MLLKPLKVLASVEGFTAFEGRLLIGLEASGHYWMSLWRFLLEHDWHVQVFNPAPSAAAIARLSLRRLEGLLIGASRGRLGAEKAMLQKCVYFSWRERLGERALC